MNKIIPIISGVAMLLIIVTVILTQNQTSKLQELPITSKYIESNSMIKQKLAEQQIQMSSPIKITNPDYLKEYCTFFTSPEKQDLVEYCTSTELKGNNDQFLGNVHMVGTESEPKAILALIQTDDSMSELDNVKIIFEAVLESVVCDCWEQKNPGDLKNMSQWIEGLKEFHESDTRPHSKSSVIMLEGKSLQLELSKNPAGYLWQFFIYN